MVINSFKKAEKTIINSTIVIILLAIIKIIVGLISNSIVLLSDGVYGLTDILTNIVSLISLKISQKKPNEKFPYGYYKAETISSLFLSLFILYLAGNLFIKGVKLINSYSIVNYIIITIFTSLSSIIVSFGLYKYLVSKGKSLNIDSLIVNGEEKKIDVFTSSIVLLSIILSIFNVPYIEGVITIIISLLIIYEGFILVKNSLLSLMDISPNKDKEKLIIKAFSNIHGIEGYANLKLRKSGPIIFGDVDLIVKKSLKVKDARKLCNLIEKKAKENLKELESLNINIYPYQVEEKIVALPLDNINSSSISNSFGISNYYMLIKIKDSKIISKKIVKNRFSKMSKKAGLYLSKELIKKGVDTIYVKKIGEISRDILKSNFVTIVKTKKYKLKKIIFDIIKSS